MIDFAVFALPRSGTTWATAWLSHYATVLHDPLMDRTPDEIMQWGDETPGPTGIVCTAGWMLPDWVERLYKDGTRVVYVVRDEDEVRSSLAQIGLPDMPRKAIRRFDRAASDLPDREFPFRWMFLPHVADGLLDLVLPTVEFNPTHHAELARMHIEPTQEVIDRLRSMARDLEAQAGDSPR